MTITLLVI